jgi:hypothetical protein
VGVFEAFSTPAEFDLETEILIVLCRPTGGELTPADVRQRIIERSGPAFAFSVGLITHVLEMQHDLGLVQKSADGLHYSRDCSAPA